MPHNSNRKSYESIPGHPGKKNKATIEKEAKEAMKKASSNKGSPKKYVKKLKKQAASKRTSSKR